MNNILHTYFSPFLYFNLFGNVGYVLIGLFFVVFLSSLKLKGKIKYFSFTMQLICVSLLLIYPSLPIDKKEDNRLREQINLLAIEIIEDYEINQKRKEIIHDFVAVIDKGYINRLEEANTYKEIVELNRKHLEIKNKKYEEVMQKLADIKEQAQD